ncbi:MAG: hypothetical protein EAX96_14420 [Candidatus Lokiarchaeota archaeon]|nr:hypothetical protein [Candidatus Lokiarchaeota archaeon]
MVEMNEEISRIIRWIDDHYDELLLEWSCIQCGDCCKIWGGYIRVMGDDNNRWENIIVKSNLGTFPMFDFIEGEHIVINPRNGEDLRNCPFLRKMREEDKYICMINDPKIKPNTCRLFQKDQVRIECRNMRALIKKKRNDELFTDKSGQFMAEMRRSLSEINKKHEASRWKEYLDKNFKNDLPPWGIVFKGYLYLLDNEFETAHEAFKQLEKLTLKEIQEKSYKSDPPMDFLIFLNEFYFKKKLRKLLFEFDNFTDILFKIGLIESFMGHHATSSSILLLVLEKDETYLDIIKNHESFPFFRKLEEKFDDFFRQISLWKKSGKKTYKEYVEYRHELDRKRSF